MVESGVEQEQGDLFLPPGFRFHPTDEEVITSYLLEKLLNPSFVPRAIGEVNLNKCEPWDLPSKSHLYLISTIYSSAAPLHIPFFILTV
jgi:hypothetical protein